MQCLYKEKITVDHCRGWKRSYIPDEIEPPLPSLLLLGVPPPLLPLVEERRPQWRSSSSSELKPDDSDVLANTNVATDDVGESVGSIGVSAGDTDPDSDPETVGVVHLSANFSATCLRNSECEFALWNRNGGVPSPFMSLFAWLLSWWILPDRSFDLWEATTWGRVTCTSDETAANLRCTLGE